MQYKFNVNKMSIINNCTGGQTGIRSSVVHSRLSDSFSPETTEIKRKLLFFDIHKQVAFDMLVGL